MAGLKNAVNYMLDKEDLKRRHVGRETLNDILKPIINVEIRKLLNKVKVLISNKNKSIMDYLYIKYGDIYKSGKNKGNRYKYPAKYKRLKDYKCICGIHSRNVEKVELPKSITYNYIEKDNKNIINIYFYIIRELVTLIIKNFSTYFKKGLNFRLIKFYLIYSIYSIYFIYNNIEYKINIYSKNISICIINKYQNVQYSILFTDHINKYQKIYEMYKELKYKNNIYNIGFDVIKDTCEIGYSRRISYKDNVSILYDNLDFILFSYLSNEDFG